MANKLKEQYIVNKSGKKTAVILPVDEFEELLEDLHDLSVIAERKNEPSISHSEVKKQLISSL